VADGRVGADALTPFHRGCLHAGLMTMVIPFCARAHRRPGASPSACGGSRCPPRLGGECKEGAGGTTGNSRRCSINRRNCGNSGNWGRGRAPGKLENPAGAVDQTGNSRRFIPWPAFSRGLGASATRPQTRYTFSTSSP
jgi:hypothetical protein